jgi:hypothetical protein
VHTFIAQTEHSGVIVVTGKEFTEDIGLRRGRNVVEDDDGLWVAR